ncbi:MAG: hypothetical protein V3U27_00915, partial [Candidatus Tectomicrobia bacterium]
EQEKELRTTQHSAGNANLYAYSCWFLIPNSHHYSHQPIQDSNGAKEEFAKLLKKKEKRSGADEN